MDQENNKTRLHKNVCSYMLDSAFTAPTLVSWYNCLETFAVFQITPVHYSLINWLIKK